MNRAVVTIASLGLAALTVFSGGRPSVFWVGDIRAGGDGGSFGVGQAGARPGEIIAFGAIDLCVDGAPSATILKLSFRDVENLVIQRYAVRRLDYSKQDALGAQRGSFDTAGFTAGQSDVTTPCRQGSPVTELALDVTNYSNRIATGKTLLVYYRAGHRYGESEVPVTIQLCPGACS